MSMQPSRRSLLASALALALAGRRSTAVAQSAEPSSGSGGGAVRFAGLNLAGADFGALPGTHGREYLYPTRKNVDYYRELGFNVIRLPFKWERLQPGLNEPFAAKEQELLVDIVKYATGSGLHIVLDPHNYAKRRIAADGWAKEYVIGTEAVPTPTFADFWSRLAKLFSGEERVIFGLMNEPVGLSATAWLGIANDAITAIRIAGARNLILVPGVAYTGAHSWMRSGNTAMAGVVDPAKHWAFDVHQYFDKDSSGTKPDSVSGSIGSERIEAFQNWAREGGFKAFLGEFNGGRNATSYNALHDFCQEMSANTDVWLGWAAWAGGPRWPENEMFNLEPWKDGRIREQTAILVPYAREQDAWVSAGAAIDVDLARGRLHGANVLSAVLAAKSGTRRGDNASDNQGGGGQGALTADRDRKGLLLGNPASSGASASQHLLATGALLSLMKGANFTLVLTMRELPTASKGCEMLSADGTSMLRRSADGALETMFGTSAQTPPQPLGNWRSKRRVAISVSREGRRVAIGVTGGKAVQVDAQAPAIKTITFGGSEEAPFGGYLARITAYPIFMDDEALDALVA